MLKPSEFWAALPFLIGSKYYMVYYLCEWPFDPPVDLPVPSAFRSLLSAHLYTLTAGDVYIVAKIVLSTCRFMPIFLIVQVFSLRLSEQTRSSLIKKSVPFSRQGMLLARRAGLSRPPLAKPGRGTWGHQDGSAWLSTGTNPSFRVIVQCVRMYTCRVMNVHYLLAREKATLLHFEQYIH